MKIDVLDHGYVRVIETWGYGDAAEPEAGIVEAARQSTQGSFRGWEEDKGLMKHLFLSRPQHATPFEFAGMVIEVQAPIFVFREWHRHRVQGYNEMSARYAPLPDVKYMPDVDRCIVEPGKNKQANPMGEKVADVPTAEAWLEQVKIAYQTAERVYQLGLEHGIPKEVARTVMPVGQYSRMRATAVLRNWFAFLRLRADPNAQWEIRQYANALAIIIQRLFPVTYELYDKEMDRETNRDQLEEVNRALVAENEALSHRLGDPE